MMRWVLVMILSTWTTMINAGNPVFLLPLPQRVEVGGDRFELTDKTVIYYEGGESEAGLLAKTLRRSTGFCLPVDVLRGESGVRFMIRPDLLDKVGPEGYQLSVATDHVDIAAPAPAGLFYGSQTFLQLLPPEIFSTNRIETVSWTAPTVEIIDSPRFPWRGFMLDCSRHFFSVSEVKRVIDLMSRYKLNVFHWHLVDDQGWRIQINQYPKLTEVGAWRKGVNFGLPADSTTAYDEQGRYGGYYTQEQIRGVVAYAADRHVTIVPEIDMPGHSIAALAAYPEYSCTGGPFDMDRNSGIFHGVYDVSNEKTYVFLGDILRIIRDIPIIE